MRRIADIETSPPGDAPQALPTFTNEQVLGQLLRWNARWAGNDIPFAFYGARPAHMAGDSWWSGFQTFSPAQREATLRAMSLIADIVPLNFIQVPDNGQAPYGANARLTFATSTSFPQFATGVAYVEASTGLDLGDQHRILGSDTLFNYTRWSGSYAEGARPFSVLMHEILHGLGLPHPGEYNRSANEEITYGVHADYAQDSAQYTVMSYFGAHETGADHAGRYPGTPLLHDVMAMQALYGANMTTRTGDTVYGFNSTAGRSALDFTQNILPVVCLWDAGGTDTLDVSGYSVAQRIDLAQGAFSNVGGLTSNVSIAYGADIENAVGGGGADTISGNGLGNRLEGGAGADILFGLGGRDVLIGGEGADWLVGGAGADSLFGGGGDDTAGFDWMGGAAKLYFLDGYVVVSGPSGVDEIYGVEWLSFLNGLVNVERPIVCYVVEPDGAEPTAKAAPTMDTPLVEPAAVGLWLEPSDDLVAAGWNAPPPNDWLI